MKIGRQGIGDTINRFLPFPFGLVCGLHSRGVVVDAFVYRGDPQFVPEPITDQKDGDGRYDDQGQNWPLRCQIARDGRDPYRAEHY